MGKKARNRRREADSPRFVTWRGETYRIADKIGDGPIMDFAEIAEQGIDSNEMRGMAAMKALLRNCLTDEDFARFWRHQARIRATGDEMMEIVKETYAALSNRPTKRPSVSSDGPPAIEVSSEGVSSSQVMRVIDSIPANRPDLKLAVWQQATA